MTANAAGSLEVNKRLEFDSEPDRVWAALTDPGQLGSWFPDAVEIDRYATGHRGWFVWNEHGRYAFEIEEMDEPSRLVWRWAQDKDVELEETNATRVEWTLAPRQDGGTVVELRETGFASAEYRGDNDAGWDKELGELVDYLQR